MDEFENPLNLTVYVVIPKKLSFQEEYNLINEMKILYWTLPLCFHEVITPALSTSYVKVKYRHFEEIRVHAFHFEIEREEDDPLEKITTIRAYIRERLLKVFKVISHQSAFVFLV